MRIVRGDLRSEPVARSGDRATTEETVPQLSGSLLPSPVLQAMSVADDVLRSALRFSLSFLLTNAEIDEAGRRVVEVVKRLRGVV